MACSIDHLNKVASEGFPLIDEFYGRQGARKAAHRYASAPSSPSPQRNQDQYHHQKLVPNQYVYHGPQAVTYVQQPETASYHQIQTNKSYERWYVCEVSQAPGGASISSNDAAAFYGGMLINDKGKTKQKQWS